MREFNTDYIHISRYWLAQSNVKYQTLKNDHHIEAQITFPGGWGGGLFTGKRTQILWKLTP
jgi:hypothetical protein